MESLNVLIREACRRIRRGDLIGAHRAVLDLVVRARALPDDGGAALAFQLQSALVLIREAFADAAFNVPEIAGDELAAALARTPAPPAVADAFEDGFHTLLRAAADRSTGRPLAERVKLYIDANFHRPGTIEELAQALGSTRASITPAFKAQEGVTPTAYLFELRLNRSEYLVRTKRSMAFEEVARRSGFGSYETFRRRFKERFGMSPSEYRKKYGGS